MSDWKIELINVQDKFYTEIKMVADKFREEIIIPICEKHNLEFIGCDELCHGTFRTPTHVYVHPYANGVGGKIFKDNNLDHVFASLSLPILHELHLYDFVKSYKRDL